MIRIDLGEAMEQHMGRLYRAITGPDPSESLVGSYFHTFKDGVVDQQGCVVGEPAPGVYLVEFFSWLASTSTCQRLFPLREMHDWNFYDSSEWMKARHEDLDYRAKAERTAVEDDKQVRTIIWKVLQEAAGKMYSVADLAAITGISENAVIKATHRMKRLRVAGTAYLELVFDDMPGRSVFYGFLPGSPEVRGDVPGFDDE